MSNRNGCWCVKIDDAVRTWKARKNLLVGSGVIRWTTSYESSSSHFPSHTGLKHSLYSGCHHRSIPPLSTCASIPPSSPGFRIRHPSRYSMGLVGHHSVSPLESCHNELAALIHLMRLGCSLSLKRPRAFMTPRALVPNRSSLPYQYSWISFFLCNTSSSGMTLWMIKQPVSYTRLRTSSGIWPLLASRSAKSHWGIYWIRALLVWVQIVSLCCIAMHYLWALTLDFSNLFFDDRKKSVVGSLKKLLAWGVSVLHLLNSLFLVPTNSLCTLHSFYVNWTWIFDQLVPLFIFGAKSTFSTQFES